MAFKNLLTRARGPTDTHPRPSDSPPPSPPNVAVKAKLKTLENPEPRFLKYGSPHPTLTSHTHILVSPPRKRPWLVFGSRFETDETNGTAHFLEHMIFKGTEKWGLRVLEEMENMGGHLNAYTSSEQTTYYARVLDILQNPTFDQARITRERDVILTEMEDVEGQTEEVIFDHLHTTAFQYTPLGRTILGPAQNIKIITKEHLQNYIHTRYTAPRMAIAASGVVKHEEVVEQVKKLFTKLSTDSAIASQLVAKEPAIFTGSELKSSLLLHIDGSSLVAEDIGRQLLTYGWRIPFAELFARIDAVDASIGKRVANKFIYDKVRTKNCLSNPICLQDIVIAAMGPIQGLPDYNWFRRRIYWNRY